MSNRQAQIVQIVAFDLDSEASLSREIFYRLRAIESKQVEIEDIAHLDLCIGR